MAKKVIQVRYYGEGNKKNFPYEDMETGLLSGDIFTSYLPIHQLGIQGMPGTEFYLNGAANGVIVGNTGIYELNVENLVEITGLKFSKRTLDNINEAKNGTQYIIIDLLYEDGKG